jgi:hypothetical protein
MHSKFDSNPLKYKKNIEVQKSDYFYFLSSVYKIVPEMLLKIEHGDILPPRCVNYAHRM